MMAWCQIGDEPLPEAMKNHINDAVRNYAILVISLQNIDFISMI